MLASLHDDACLSCPSALSTSEKARVSVLSLESETLLANVAKADGGLTCKPQPLRFRAGLLLRPLHLPGGSPGSASWMMQTCWAKISISRSLGSETQQAWKSPAEPRLSCSTQNHGPQTGSCVFVTLQGGSSHSCWLQSGSREHSLQI